MLNYVDILVAVRDRLKVMGHWLEIESWGSGDPPIVLLHEGLGSVTRWRAFPPELAATVGRRVIAYSRAGHGSSDTPAVPHTPRFMHEEAIEWLPELLDTMAVDHAVLLGHSDGASIALVFAATYPSRVDALILEAPHVFVEDISIESSRRIQERYATTDLRERLAKHHQHVDAAFHGWNDIWLDPAFRSWNLEEYLPQISCPVLLIQGEQDEYGTIQQIETITQSVRGRVDTVLLPDCKHTPHRDQPERTLSAIKAFLAGAPQSHSMAG